MIFTHNFCGFSFQVRLHALEPVKIIYVLVESEILAPSLKAKQCR